MVALTRGKCAVLVIGVGLAFAPVASAASRPAEVPLIAAASSLRPALEEVSARFTAETGRRVRFSYASSGVLAMQILRGAPVELFLSADEAYVDRLVDRGAVSERGKVYARGRLVIFVTHGADFDIDRGVEAFAHAVAEQRIRRLAIAHPEHAPYGRAARRALSNLGVWQKIGNTQLVIGENAAQAARFAATGAVDAALLPLSLASQPALSARGKYVLLADKWHPPLSQRMVLLPGAGTTATRFFEFVRSGPAAQIWHRYGFEPAVRYD